MCLDKRGKQQLSALLWRAKVVCQRNKRSVIKSMIMPLLLLIGIVIFKKIAANPPYNVQATNFITATTSQTPISTSNSASLEYGTQFGTDYTLTTNFTLPNCTNERLTGIGIVYPDNGYATASAIAIQLQLGYFANTGVEMTIQNFTDADELDSFVTQRDYDSSKNKQLCFAFGFNVFDIQTNTFEIEMFFNQIVNNRLNQVQWQAQKYDVEVTKIDTKIPAFQAFNASGFQQFMTTATYQILNKNYAMNPVSGIPLTTPQFQIAYLPLNTGQQKYLGSELAVLLMFPTLVFFGIGIAEKIMNQIVPENDNGMEPKLIGLLKLQGMKANVFVVYEAVLYFGISMPIVILIAAFSRFLIIPNIGFFVILVLAIFVAVESFLIVIISKYGMSRTAGIIFRVSYAFIMIVAGIFNSLYKSVTPFMVYITSIFPILQMQNLARLAGLALQTDRKLHFGNLSDPIADVKTSNIFTIAAAILVIQLITLAWLWPMNVDPDPERNLKCWYPFTPSFWCHKQKKEEVDDEDNESATRLINQSFIEEDLQQDELDMIQTGLMEKPNVNVSSERLVISKLVKIYGKQTVVNNLSLTLFKNQILVLLGHNGAGKTTTISMLTNAVKATSGSATAYGVNLLKDFSNAVDMVGLCPQETVLLYKLTVRENILFFLKFKGFENPEQVVTQQLQNLGMLHKDGALASSLSGGQKRKLQLILALMGNNKLVFLDEPTSGMDPTSRRQTWDVLRAAKQDKILILTTHYMDEAENLADRVAIVSKGKLECCGSTLFLKDKYTKGFFIEIEKANSEPMPMLEQLLEKYTAKAGIFGWNFEIGINESGATTYTLPKEVGNYFSEIFKEIDFDLAKFGISKYRVRSANLEEVFIAIGEKEHKVVDEIIPDDESRRSSTQTRRFYSKEKQTCCQTYTTFQKMAFRGSVFNYCCAFLMVPIVVLMVCAFAIISVVRSSSALTISDWQSIYGSEIYIEMNSILANGDTNSFFANTFLPSTTLPLSALETTNVLGTPTSVNLQSYANLISPCLMYDAGCTAGAYYVYSMQTSDADFTQIAIYGNLASVTSQNVLGANLMSAIANYYTGKTFSMTFVNSPLENNKNMFLANDPSPVNSIFTLGGEGLLVLEVLVAYALINRFENGWYNQLMMKSGSVFNYVISCMVADSLIFLYAGVCFMVIPIICGFNIPDTYLPALLYIGAELCNIYFLCFALIRDRGFQGSRVMGILFIEVTLSLFFGGLSSTDWFKSTISHSNVKHAYFVAFVPQANYLWSLFSIEARTMVAGLHGHYGDVNPLGKYGCEFFIYCQLVAFISYLILLTCSILGLFLPSAKSKNLKPTQEENEDKLIQKQRLDIQQQLINNNGSAGGGDLLQCLDLTKQYTQVDPSPTDAPETDRPMMVNTNTQEVSNPKNKGTFAVKGVSFGVQQGEVFGLLGVNGAGKSSTFNMLCGNEVLSGGKAFLNGVNIEDIYKKPQDLIGLIGYCPQYDTISGYATVKTQLHDLAALLGVEEENITNYVNDIIERFALSDFPETMAIDLSGGNKRKLTLAIAMMGNPKIIYIDEASAGVDPVSRRQLWKAIRYEGRNSAVIMTTHAMEEAEALCQRIGVMVAGLFKCLGSQQEIKDTYGLGYEIEFQLDLEYFENQISQLVTIDDSHLRNNNDALVKEYLRKWMQIKSDDFVAYIQFEEELSIGGLFHDQNEKLKTGKSIDLHALVRDCFVNNAVAGIVQTLIDDVGETKVLKFDGSYVHLSLKENKFSSGFLHGIIEDLKKRYPISGYVCNQSSLEQIFNAFAQAQKFDQYTRRINLRQKNDSVQM